MIPISVCMAMYNASRYLREWKKLYRKESNCFLD